MADNSNIDDIKNTAKINELLEKRKEIVGDINIKVSDLTVAQKYELDLLEKKIELERSAQKERIEQIKAAQAVTKELEEQLLQEKDSNVQKKIKQDLVQKQIELERLVFKEREAIGNLTEEEIANHKEYLKDKQQELEKDKEIVKLEEKKVDLKNKLKDSWGAITKYSNLLTGNLTTDLFNLISVQGVLGNIGKMFSEVVTTNEKLAQTTGQVGLMTGGMATGLAEFGVGYKEMGEAVGTLYNEMSAFSNQEQSVRDGLAKNVAVMGNLGVSASTTAKNYDLLNKSLKFSVSDLADVNNKLAKSAIGAGIAPQKMLNDFSSVMPQLAANGKKAVDIFIQMEKQSKALGLEIGSLLGIVGQFDTFEGAAEKAGRLNAILGGDYLNSVEMLNATEEERVEILKKSFEASGKSFDTMDRFEQKAIASAMGLKDVTEAQKLFGHMSIENKIKMEAEAASQEKLEEAQKNAASTSRQLQMVYSNLLIAIEPLAKMFKEMTIFIAEHQRVFSAFFGVMAALVASGMILKFVLSIKTMVSGLFSLGTASKVLAPAGEAAGTAIGNFGRSASSAIPFMLAFAGAIALIGVGIGVAAYGIGHLAESFSKLNKEQIEGVTVAMGGLMGMLAIMGVVIVAAGMAASAGAVGFLVFGAAVLMVTGGIALMSLAMAKLVDSIAALNTSGMAGNGLVIMKESLTDIIDLISEMPDEVEFTTKLNQLQSLGQTIKTVSESAPTLAPAKEFVVAAKDYYVAQRESKDADTDALVQALKKVVPTQPATATKSPSGTPVILRIENGPDLRAYVLGEKAILT
jgi:hypothetical protein